MSKTLHIHRAARTKRKFNLPFNVQPNENHIQQNTSICFLHQRPANISELLAAIRENLLFILLNYYYYDLNKRKGRNR